MKAFLHFLERERSFLLVETQKAFGDFLGFVTHEFVTWS